jgi:hypothetical protein
LRWFQETLKEAKEHISEPKRLMRESRALERFGSYLAMVTSNTDSEPTTFERAVDQQVWREAMQEKYDSIMRNDVWEVVPRPEGKSVVTSKWLYKTKYATNGNIEKRKARFVARGFSQIEGIESLTMMRHSHQLQDILPSGVSWPLLQRWVGRSIRWM